MSKVSDIAKEVRERITALSEIHDELFTFSLRKIIPIPFLFKKIDFDETFMKATLEAKELALLSVRIMDLIEETDGHKISYALEKYANSAMKIAMKLAIVADLLIKKRDGESMNKDQYESDLSEYGLLLEENEKRRLELVKAMKDGLYGNT